MTIIFKRLKARTEKLKKKEEDLPFDSEHNTFVHPKRITFNLNIPIMTGTFCDPIVNMSPRKKWDKGLDLNHSGGNFILSGNMY